MTYEDKAHAFWRDVGCEVKPVSVVLFFALLEMWHRQCAPPRLFLDNSTLCALMRIDVRTLRKARAELMSRGLIWYEHHGNNAGAYILDADEFPKVEPDEVLDPPTVEPVAPVEVKAEPVQTELMFPEERPKKKRTTTKRPKTTEPAFTLEQVIAAFIAAGSDADEAKKFYYYYDSQDWHKGNGRSKVTRLDSAVNGWLLNPRRQDGKRGTTNRNADKREERNRKVAEWVLDGLQD